MKNKAENRSFNVFLVAVCSFVGVGFITGAEIWFYFARFGVNMLVGIVVFAAVSFILVYYSISTKQIHNKKFLRAKTAISALSEFLIASAMVSGLLEISQNLFGKFWLLVFFLAIIVVIFIYFKGIKSFIFYNYFVAIFVIFVIISLFLFNNENTLNFSSDFSVKEMLFSCFFALIYIFMNIAEIRPILAKYNQEKGKKNKTTFAILFSLTLIFLVIMLSIKLILNKSIVNFSMPFLLYFKNNTNGLFFVFLIGLVLCLLSTLLSCLIGVKDKFIIDENDKNFVKIIVIISSLIFGQISFSVFVMIVYPIIAVLNFGLFVAEIVLRHNRRCGK